MKYCDIPIGNIQPNEYNPNRLGEKYQRSLERRIKKDNSLIAPIIVTERGGKYIIIDGEHRYIAAKKAGLETIPCIVRDVDDKRAKLETLILSSIHGRMEDKALVDVIEDIKDTFELAEIGNDLVIEDISKLIKVEDYEYEAKQTEETIEETMVPFSIMLNNQAYETIKKSLKKVRDKVKIGKNFSEYVKHIIDEADDEFIVQAILNSV